MDKEKYGPWAVIIGGSEGVGASFAHQLAGEGINVFLIARKPGPLAEAKEQIEARFGVEVGTLSLDVTADDMLDQVARATRDLDVGLLIYNAGSAVPKAFLDSPLSAALNTIRLNPVGQISFAHHFGQRMRERGRGGMIFVGSLSGNAGGGGHAAYCGSKAFTQMLSEALWAEFKPLGIDVLGLIIGATRTPWMERAGLPLDLPEYPADDPDDVARAGLENLANGPIQTPAHLQEAFAFLSSAPRDKAAMLATQGIASMTPAKP